MGVLGRLSTHKDNSTDNYTNIMDKFILAVFLVLASILVVTRCAPFPQEDDSLLEEDAEYLDDAIEYYDEESARQEDDSPAPGGGFLRFSVGALQGLLNIMQTMVGDGNVSRALKAGVDVGTGVMTISMSVLRTVLNLLQGLTTRDGRALTLEDDLTAPISEDGLKQLTEQIQLLTSFANNDQDQKANE